MKNTTCHAFRLIAVLAIVIIAVAALFLPTCASASGDTNSDSPIPGDLNGDGVVNILDFILLKMIIMGQATPTDIADVDGNGIINAMDITAMLGQIFGKAASLGGGGSGGGGGGGGGGVVTVTNQVNFELSIYQSTYGPGTTANTFTARVKIAQTSYLYNGTFTVDYDPLILKVNDVTDGLFATTCVIDMAEAWTDAAGQLTISPNLSSCAVNGSGISGSGYLCNISFETKDVGTSPLTLNGTLYQSQSGNISAITGTTWINSSAQISQSYSLTTSVTGTGSASGDGNYDSGSLADITATETDACWVFDHWSGTGITNVNDPTTTVLIDGDKTVTAVFVLATYDLTTAHTGTGSTSGDGSFLCGNLSAINAIETDACWYFDHWSGTGITNVNLPTTTVLMNASKTVTAVFTQRSYTLTTDHTGTGSTSGDGSFLCGNLSAINAIETDACWAFDHWTGSGITNVNLPTTTVLMNASKTVTAVFTQRSYTLTPSSDSNGSVTIPGESGSYAYACGTNAQIVAVPAQCYIFNQWTGTGVSKVDDRFNESTTILMDGNYDIRANFVIGYSFNLTLAADPPGGGSPYYEGTGTYGCGTEVIIHANTSSCYDFVNWTGSPYIDEPNSADTTVQMYTDYTVTAHYTIKQHTLTTNVLPSGAEAAGCTVTGGDVYDCGITAPIQANPAGLYSFAYWTSADPAINGSTDMSESVLMNSNKAVTANFIINPNTVYFENVGAQTVGIQFTVNISITDSIYLTYAYFDLGFNSSILQLDGILAVNWGNQFNPTTVSTDPQGAGLVRVIWDNSAWANVNNGYGVNASGALCTAYFTPLATGTSPLNFVPGTGTPRLLKWEAWVSSDLVPSYWINGSVPVE